MKVLRSVADQAIELGMENHGSGILSSSLVALSSTFGDKRTINDTGMPLVERGSVGLGYELKRIGLKKDH